MGRLVTTPRTLAAVIVAAVVLTVPQVRSASQTADDGGARAGLEEQGRQLYLTGCSTCHGADGRGTDLAPAVTNSGEAGVDFMLRTGRMPAAAPGGQQPSKPPAYDDDEIEALVAYVGGLGDGPPIPDVDPARGDVAVGGELFRANCAACHNAAGAGGVLSNGQYAPSLLAVDPTQVGEAMRFGPGQMPVFDDDTFDRQDVDDIVAYVEYLQEPDDAGGLRIGGIGPVPEGFVAVLFGLGTLVLLTVWVTRSSRA